VAINEHEKSILLTILNSVVSIYFYCINKDLEREDIEELDNILANLLILLVESNNLLPIEFPLYLAFIKINIISLLKKQKIYIIDYPEKRLLSLLRYIINRAIIIKAENIAIKTLENLFDIIYETIESSDILPLKKNEIVYLNCYYYKEYFLKMFNQGYYVEETLSVSFKFDKLIFIIRKNSNLAKEIIILYCTILLDLIDRGTLDKILIENLGTIGRNIISSDDINNSNEYILYIFKIMSEMKSKIEETSNRITLEQYNVLLKQAKKMREMIDNDKQKFSKIYEKILYFGNFDSSIIARESDKDWPKLD
jgi:hypothetical protein